MGGLETKSAILYRGKRPSPGFWGVSGAACADLIALSRKSTVCVNFAGNLFWQFWADYFLKRGIVFSKKNWKCLKKRTW